MVLKNTRTDAILQKHTVCGEQTLPGSALAQSIQKGIVGGQNKNKIQKRNDIVHMNIAATKSMAALNALAEIGPSDPVEP